MAEFSYRLPELFVVLCVFGILSMTDRMHKIHFLKSMEILKGESDNLLMLSLSGYSNDVGAGLPVLRVKKQQGLKHGILEFDFLIKPVDIVKKASIDFYLDVVFNLNLLPASLKGIKVTAENNADIMLV